MSYEFFQKLSADFQKARQAKTDARELLQRAYQDAADPEDKYHALSFLALECCDHGDLDGAERALKQAAALMPDVSASWISLAYFYWRHRRDEKKALRAIDEAVSERCDLSSLYSYVHTERVKIGIILGKKDVVESSLEKMLDKEEQGRSDGFALPPEIVPSLREMDVRADLFERFLDLAYPEKKFQS